MDECVSPARISELPFNESNVITENATRAYWPAIKCPLFQVPFHGNGFGLWYELTGTGSCMTASTEGSEIDTVLGVYAGDDCSDHACIGNNDDHEGFSSQVTWRSNFGTTYKIHVGGYNHEMGAYDLNVTVRFGLISASRVPSRLIEILTVLLLSFLQR